MPESWDEIIAEVARRTVHVACLPFNATLEKLVERFSDFGSVNQVRLLKRTSEVSEHRVFRGTCLIELGTEEEAKAVLATPVEYDDCLVRIQTKADYDAATQKVGFFILLSSSLQGRRNRAHRVLWESTCGDKLKEAQMMASAGSR